MHHTAHANMLSRKALVSSVNAVANANAAALKALPVDGRIAMAFAAVNVRKVVS